MTTTADNLDAAMCQYELNDTHRRIRNILDKYPPNSSPSTTAWSLHESKAVLVIVSAICRARLAHGGADDIGCFSEELTGAAAQLQRLAAVMMCDKCDTNGWLWGLVRTAIRSAAYMRQSQPDPFPRIGPSPCLGGGPTAIRASVA